MFLTIDHINNDGHKQRRKISTQLYKSIIDDGFPDDFYNYSVTTAIVLNSAILEPVLIMGYKTLLRQNRSN